MNVDCIQQARKRMASSGSDLFFQWDVKTELGTITIDVFATQESRGGITINHIFSGRHDITEVFDQDRVIPWIEDELFGGDQ